MSITFLSRKQFFYSLSFVLLFLFVAGWTQAATKNDKAVFLPFSINHDSKYNYLSDALTSVLSNQVAEKSRIGVLHSTAKTARIRELLLTGKQKEAFELLNQTGASHVVMGSLAGAGNSFLITVQVLSKDRLPHVSEFTARADSLDELMVVMESLADKIDKAVFVDEGAGDEEIVGSRVEHPEAAYRRWLKSGAGLDFGSLKVSNVYRSGNLPINVNDMVAADLDDDEQAELLLATDRNLFVYKVANGVFKQIASLDLARYLRIHSLSVADLDNNGRKEIYVSSNNGPKPSSAVVEFNGGKLIALKENIPWYLRVVEKENKPLLLGQRGGRKNKLIGEQVYLMSWNGSGVQQGERVTLPPGLTIFDISFANLDGSSGDELVGLSRNNILQVYDWQNKEVIGGVSGKYGVSENYLGTISEVAAGDIERFYIPTRIVTADINSDGSDDLILVRNIFDSLMFMDNSRFFKEASLVAFSWQDGNLKQLWESGKRADYIVNLDLDSMGKSGKLHLFFVQKNIANPFVFWQSSKSRLVLYEVNTEIDK